MEFSFGGCCGSGLKRGYRFGCRGLWGRWVKAVFEEGSDVPLDGLELVELQIGINDGENVTGGRLFVNENALAIADDLLFDLEEALSFEHDGQDIASGNVLGVVEFDELSQKRLGGFFLNGFVRGWRGVVNAMPV